MPWGAGARATCVKASQWHSETVRATGLGSDGRPVIDGNIVGFVAPEGPSVFALPSYADQPRLLAAPGAGTTFAAGGTWTTRVVASRVLSSCQVEIRNAANALVRALSCLDPHAATTITWDGRDTAGAAAPNGQYTWRIVGAVDSLSLADYDGSTTALSGPITVSGVSTGPTVTAQSPGRECDRSGRHHQRHGHVQHRDAGRERNDVRPAQRRGNSDPWCRELQRDHAGGDAEPDQQPRRRHPLHRHPQRRPVGDPESRPGASLLRRRAGRSPPARHRQ